MIHLRNTFYNNKAPVDNVQSLAARRYQQANLHQSGIRILPDYPIQFKPSSLRLVCGLKVASSREAGTVLCCGGQP